MPFAWLSDFKVFPCQPTNILSFGRSHIISSVSSFLFCSQIHSIIIRVLLSILIRPDLVGDLQWQVGPWLLFYYNVTMLRPCLCFYVYFPFLQVLIDFVSLHLCKSLQVPFGNGIIIKTEENSIAQSQVHHSGKVNHFFFQSKKFKLNKSCL